LNLLTAGRAIAPHIQVLKGAAGRIGEAQPGTEENLKFHVIVNLIIFPHFTTFTPPSLSEKT